MRPEYRPRGSLGLRMPVSTLLMIVLIICFALQQIDLVYFHGSYLDELVLSVDGLRHWHLWQLLTFQFLHANFWHIFWNLLGLWFFARYVEERLGAKQFLAVYFLSGVAGGLFQSLLMWLFPAHFGSVVYGASAGICGLVAAFALMDPDAVILAYMVLPVRAKYLLYIEGGIEFFFTCVPSDNGVAHGAHLGGILFTVAYMRWGINLSQNLSEWNPLQRKLRRERMIKAATVKPPLAKLRRRASNTGETTELPSEEFISQQVDPILDKISAHGIQSLTERERAILQAARAKMSSKR